MNNDILSDIFKYLYFKNILNCFSVCKQFNTVANNGSNWKSFLNDHFNIYDQFVTKNKFFSFL